jgi:hypothetical protein
VAQHELRGVIASATQLVGLDLEGRQIATLKLLSEPREWSAVTRARARVEALACSLSGEFIAWRDEAGELGVFSVERQELVLRLHVRDATKEIR